MLSGIFPLSIPSGKLQSVKKQQQSLKNYKYSKTLIKQHINVNANLFVIAECQSKLYRFFFFIRNKKTGIRWPVSFE